MRFCLNKTVILYTLTNFLRVKTDIGYFAYCLGTGQEAWSAVYG